MNAWAWAQEVFETSWRASWLILALACGMVALFRALPGWLPAQRSLRSRRRAERKAHARAQAEARARSSAP